jgi:hypothetical protein
MTLERLKKADWTAAGAGRLYLDSRTWPLTSAA